MDEKEINENLIKGLKSILKDVFFSYARHSPGCNAPFGYRCRCGYDELKKEVLKTLKGKIDENENENETDTVD